MNRKTTAEVGKETNRSFEYLQPEQSTMTLHQMLQLLLLLKMLVMMAAHGTATQVKF